MKNEEENVIYTLDGVTVGYPQPNRVYICGRDVTDYRTWKEFEQIVTDQSNQIRSLEEQLKNAIVPKFKIGDCAWFVYNGIQKFPFAVKITDFRYTYSNSNFYYGCNAIDSEYELFREDCFFATREEADKRLAELEGK